MKHDPSASKCEKRHRHNKVICFERRGHWQLGVRCCVTFVQSMLAVSLALVGTVPIHSCALTICHLIASFSFFMQCWTALDAMFVVRAAGAWGRVALSAHLATCGPSSPPACEEMPWDGTDIRIPMRVLDALMAIRVFAIGWSLLMQYLTPSLRSTPFRGHDELRRRSYYHASGVPINIARDILIVSTLQGTRHQRSLYEIFVFLVNAVVLIPINAWSLRRQWQTPPKREFTSSAAATDDLDAAQPPRVRKDVQAIALLAGAVRTASLHNVHFLEVDAAAAAEADEEKLHREEVKECGPLTPGGNGQGSLSPVDVELGRDNDIPDPPSNDDDDVVDSPPLCAFY